jgi:hypothetical protein
LENLFLWLALFAGYVVTILIGGVGAVFIWKIFVGTIDLTKLISEKDGTASLSRLQLLIFTFVVAIGLLVLILGNLSNGEMAFPDIGNGVLMLIGISGGSYVVSKGIQKNYEAKTEGTPTDSVKEALVVQAEKKITDPAQ